MVKQDAEANVKGKFQVECSPTKSLFKNVIQGLMQSASNAPAGARSIGKWILIVL